MNEVWKDIPGFNGRYQCSNIDNVRSSEWIDKAGIVRKSRMRKPCCDTGGYLQLILIGEPTKPHRVHRLIAITFIPEIYGKPFVNHINGIKTDNRVENLEWVTKAENGVHAVNIGLHRALRGEENGNRKLTNDDVLKIRSRYKKGIYSTDMIAKDFNISRTNAKDIVKRRTWKHI